ncbi:hypothetical protein V1460_32865 [Streptomyces sp. SCSIO 30461]|uniref:hypothetical protein n=1 Tax=Streptomyces sp. SCSIO 30461 TaxID=3118085 RepID=UPI0030CA99D3
MSYGGPQWPQEPRRQSGQSGQSGPGSFGAFEPFEQYRRPDHESQTPDWAALADASAARTRRRRWLLTGGGVLATAAIATLVATAVVSDDGDNGKGGVNASGKSASELPSAPALPGEKGAEPSFSSVAQPPPPNPKEFVSDARKDTAPLSADTLFPGKKLTMSGRVYAKGPTARTASCASVAQGSLGAALTGNGCDQVIRATYTKDGVAVTVGVAVFPTEAKAQAAVRKSARSIVPLSGSGVGAFCKGGPVCRFVGNSYGRYAYFTTTGNLNGKSITKGDRKAFQLGDDLAEFTFRQIVARGAQQAEAAAAQ